VKVLLDFGACTGHGRCYALAPEVFGTDDQGKCVLLIDSVPPELEDKARLGVANCPEDALSVDIEENKAAG